MSVDLSGCVGLERIKAKGSGIAGVNLPVGGRLRVLELPATTANLTLREQAHFERLDMEGFDSLTTLRIENTPHIPYEQIITNANNLNRVRLLGVEWQASSQTALQACITRLESCIGLDAAGANTPAAVVTGRVYVDDISADLLTEINDSFPQLVVVVAGGATQYIVRYVDWDNTLLYRAVVAEGSAAPDPVAAGYIQAPTRSGTDGTGFTFADFGALPQDVRSNLTVTARYEAAYHVLFMNGDVQYSEQWVKIGEDAASPAGTPAKESTAQYSYTFAGWARTQDATSADSGALAGIDAPRTLYAVFTATVRTYTVTFYNGSTLLQTVNDVPYGGNASYTGTTPVSPDGSAEDYPFVGWEPAPQNITGDTLCYAQFESPVEVKEISDSWDEILAACADGTFRTKYRKGNYKPLDMGTEGVINMQIVGKEVDTLADGSGMAPLSWIGIELLKTSKRMNPVGERDPTDDTKYIEGTGAIGGWERSELRKYYRETLMPLVPGNVRAGIKTVLKSHEAYNTESKEFMQTTEENLWIPSYTEVYQKTSQTNQPAYNAIYPDSASRKKSKIDATSTSWWLRAAYGAGRFYGVGTEGLWFQKGYVYYSGDLPIGFCT